MADLAEFLLARIAEDEAVAADANVDSAKWWVDGPGERSGHWWIYGTGQKFAERSTADHIARHDPARVLAECEAKRRIVERASHDYRKYDGERIVELAGYTLRNLALPYADHPDYDEAWRP